MKLMEKITLGITLLTLFASCQPKSDTKQALSKSESRMEMMETIANDGDMSKEMMEAMMNSKNGKMMMQENEKMSMMMMENHGAMMKMMKDKPEMMKSMMDDMMETCKTDSTMMATMCKTMMDDPKMMEMMEKMKHDKMDMSKMKGMDAKKPVDHSKHK